MSDLHLSRRERQIMDIVFRLGRASVVEIQAELPDAPTDAAIRRMLKILEEKKRLRCRRDGRRMLYSPVQARGRAAKSALNRVLTTFFDGSIEQAFASWLADPKQKVDPEQLKRLSRLIEEAEQKEQADE